jgi:hypothetical protein
MYAREFNKAAAWIGAFVPFALTCHIMGYDWLLLTTPGQTFMLARIVISVILAVDVFNESNWKK